MSQKECGAEFVCSLPIRECPKGVDAEGTTAHRDCPGSGESLRAAAIPTPQSGSPLCVTTLWSGEASAVSRSGVHAVRESNVKCFQRPLRTAKTSARLSEKDHETHRRITTGSLQIEEHKRSNVRRELFHVFCTKETKVRRQFPFWVIQKLKKHFRDVRATLSKQATSHLRRTWKTSDWLPKRRSEAHANRECEPRLRTP